MRKIAVAALFLMGTLYGQQTYNKYHVAPPQIASVIKPKIFSVQRSVFFGQNVGHAPVALNPCLISAWAMNEGSGTTLHDTSTGATNTATTTGTITWQSNAGLPGTTVSWGSPSSATATSTTLTNFTGTTPFSVSVWARPNNSATSMMGTLDTANSFKGWGLEFKVAGGNPLDFFLVNSYSGNAIDVQAVTGVASGTVGYFVATYDGSQTAAGVKLYAQGSALTTSTNFNSLSASAANSLPVRFGSRNNGTNQYTGAMAFAEVYNCVLTPTQIATYFANGPGIY